MSRKQLETVEEVLDALGGNAEAARALGEKPVIIGMWRMREKIPPSQFLNVMSALDAKGLVAHSRVFGMREPV